MRKLIRKIILIRLNRIMERMYNYETLLSENMRIRLSHCYLKDKKTYTKWIKFLSKV